MLVDKTPSFGIILFVLYCMTAYSSLLGCCHSARHSFVSTKIRSVAQPELSSCQAKNVGNVKSSNQKE
jgi:hypothetical protein